MNELATTTQEDTKLLVIGEDETVELPVSLQGMENLITRAVNAEIVTADDMGAGGDLQKICRTTSKRLDELRKEAVAPHNERVHTINGAFKFWMNKLTEAAEAIRRKCDAWQDEEDRKAREEEQRLKAEAEAKAAEEAAEIERQAAEKRAEAARIREAAEAAERQRKLDAEKRATEASSAEEDAQAEHESAVAAAEAKDAADIAQAEADALQEKAEHHLEEAADAPAQQVASKQTHHGDFGTTVGKRTNWDFELIDIRTVPEEYLLVDEQRVKQAIRRKNNPEREIAGLRIFPTTRTVAR